MDLKTIKYNNDRITLSARELHEFLEIGTRYNDWFQRMCEYGFNENLDYRAITQKRVTAQGNETTYTDHEITLDMAKEISMLQRNEKGKQARLYFIELEKRWNSPEFVMNRALEYSKKQIETLQLENKMKDQQIAELKPKADYTDTILRCKNLVITTAIAKDYGMSATEFNKILHQCKVQYKIGDQWFLYQKHQDKGYTSSDTVYITHKDGTKSSKMNTKWTQKGRLFLYNLLKDNGIVPMIEKV